MADDFNKDNDLDITIGYNDVGEKAAIKGAENVSKAIEKVGKKAKQAGGTDLQTLENGLLKVSTASNSVANGQKKVSDALSSTVAKLQAQNTALRETVAQFSKVTSMSGHRSVSAKMASSSGLGLDVKKFAAAPAVQSGMDYRKHLKNINSVTTQLEKYTQKTITSVAAIEKKTQAEVKNISKMKTTESQLAAVTQLEKNLSSTILETSNTLSSTSVVTANFSKNLDGLVKVTKDDSDAIKNLKNNTVASYNAFEASNRVLQEHKTILTTLKEKTANYRKELQEKQKLEKETARLTDEQQKITLLDQQNQRLAVAKAEFDAMSTAAEKYKNTLEAATRVGANGYVPMATNAPYTPTGAELTSKLTDMGGNYAELKKVTDARQQSTAALIAEAAQFAKNAKEADSYEDKLKFTEMATEKLKEASLANKSALFDIGTLANQTGANLKTYTKYIQDNDTATLALKNGVVDLSNQLIDSRDGLRAQSKGITENITNLNTERKSIIENIKAQKELEKARLKTQASQNAMTQLQGVPAGIGGTATTLATRATTASAALTSAKDLKAAADASDDYLTKITLLDDAYNTINDSMKENSLVIKEAELVMRPLIQLYDSLKNNLDENDSEAMDLKRRIEELIATYDANKAALKNQNIEMGRTKNNLQAEGREWKVLAKVSGDANRAMEADMKKRADTIRQQQARVKESLQDVAMLTRSWGMSFSRYVTAPLVAAGVQAVKFTAQMEMNIKSLEILLRNDAEAAQALYTQVTQYAAKTPYEIPDLTDATKQLLAFGSASKDVMHELSMLGDLAQNDAEKLDSITSAFGKVQARGVAHMRELNRFIMAGVPIIQTLGTVMNKSSDELFKAVEQGQVSFGAIKQAIERLTSEGERFYNMSEKLSSTVKGRWSTMSDEINLALKSFADDYMPIILTWINKIISFAQAIQTMTKQQRDMILGWVKVAVAIGPVLLGISKLVSTTRVLYDIISKIVLVMGLSKAVVAPWTTIIMALATLAVGSWAMNIKKKVEDITTTFKAQESAVKSLSTTIGNAYRSKEAELAYSNAISVLQKETFNNLTTEDIRSVIEEYTPDTASKELIKLNTYVGEKRERIKELTEMSEMAAKDFEKMYGSNRDWLKAQDEGISAVDFFGENYQGTDAYARIQAMRDMQQELFDLLAGIETAKKETMESKSFIDLIAEALLGARGADIPDVATLLQLFKTSTEDAINGTLEQFDRFVGAIPQMDKVRLAFQELVGVGVTDFTNTAGAAAPLKIGGIAALTPELGMPDIKDALKKYGLEKNAMARKVLEYLVDPNESDELARKNMAAFFDGLIGQTVASADEYINTIKSEFSMDNLGEILLDPVNNIQNLMLGEVKLSPELIQEQADNLADGYLELAQAAVKSILDANVGMTFSEALSQAMSGETTKDIFSNLITSLKGSQSLKNYTELKKLVTQYTDEVATLGMSDIKKFNYSIDKMVEELKGSEYEDLIDADLLKQNYAQIEYSTFHADLQMQYNELTMNADAYYALTLKNKGFNDEQIETLAILNKQVGAIGKVTEALKAQQDFYDSLGKKEYTPIEDIFGTFSATDLQKLTGMSKFGKGTIDLSNRPTVDLGDGSVGTILSSSFDTQKGDETFKVLIPQIVNGVALSAQEALEHYISTGGKDYLMKINTSKMTTPEIEAAQKEMDAYAELLHKYEEYRIDMVGVKDTISESVGKALSKDVSDRTDTDLKSLEAWEKFTDVIKTIEDMSAADPKYDSTTDSLTALVTLINSLRGITVVNDKFKGFKDTLKGIGEELRNMAFEGLINSIEAVGEAWGAGADMGDAFEESIRNTVKAIIDALPQLLMNAGLKLITEDNPAGWAFLAASGAAALLKGYVSGRTEGNKDGTTTGSNLNVGFSAKGDSFDRGRILNVPTIFNTASGLNIGGELGTEAILPLSRDSNGRLGVNVAGSGGGNTIAVPVTVNIVNQSGVETEAEVSETTNADGGKNIEVIIKKIVNKGMANGEYDRTMKSRYGLSNRGVS